MDPSSSALFLFCEGRRHRIRAFKAELISARMNPYIDGVNDSVVDYTMVEMAKAYGLNI